MEDLVMSPEFWRAKSVLVTGHTGFKGSWLSLWLQLMGAEVHGLALAPSTSPSLFNITRVSQEMASSTICDIRNYEDVLAAMQAAKPEIVIHMAAQPIVRLSYCDPVATYATNIMGTVHVLEAARHACSVKAIVNVTSDKCYENNKRFWGYCEEDPMGGYDPYSNSKGCAELVTSAYRRSFFQQSGIALGSGRAGNVIGGGDWAVDRLIPDILNAFLKKKPVVIRNPSATRPWQHVLEPLSGYLTLAERLHADGQAFAEGWNFGPLDEDARPVQWIVEYMVSKWGQGASWRIDERVHPHEANYLQLDISKACSRLNWRPALQLNDALNLTVDWAKQYKAEGDMRQLTLDQIGAYQKINESTKFRT